MGSDIKKNPGSIPTDGTTESDIGSLRKKTLGDYLKAATRGAATDYTDTNGTDENENPIGPEKVTINSSQKNYYPIDFESNSEIALGEDGLPMPISEIEDSQAHFIAMNQAKEIYNKISSGIFFDEPDAIKVVEDVGGVSDPENFKGTQEFGHQIGTTGYVQTVSEQVSSVLLNNRFSPAFDAVSIESSETDQQRKFRSSTVDGSDGQIYFNDLAGPDTQNDALRTMGAEAMLGASGFTGNDPSVKNTDWYSAFDGIFSVFSVKNIIPNAAGEVGLSAATRGDELGTGAARISDTVTNPTKEWINNKTQIDLTYIDHTGRPTEDQNPMGDETTYSYGVMNNYIDQFTDSGGLFGRQYIQSIGFMTGIFVQNILYAVALDLIILLEFAAFEAQRKNLFSQYGPDTGTQLAKGKRRGYVVPKNELNPYITRGALPNIMDLMGVPNPSELFSGPALVELIFNFLGIQKPVGTRTYFEIQDFPVGLITSFLPAYLIGSIQTTISAVKDPMSAGFFNNLGRQIMRQSAERAPPPGESGGDAFLSWFLALREQASFRFFKTMIDLGDNSIGQYFYEWSTTAQESNTPHSTLDAVYNTRVSAAGGMRSPASTMLAPSLFFVPKSFNEARRLLSNNPPPDAEGNPVHVFKSGIPVFRGGEGGHLPDQFYSSEDAKENKIDNETAAMVEKKLDAEYMPFYIKDMRTNEIISFHAFLNSFSDGFTATYGKIKGMGRIENAPIYDSTSRAISIGFTAMAFSPEDLDMLYFKINKLVTLLYPQWSKGTLMKGGPDGLKPFRMPFSQIPTASPMVRLRIGDILTSNFSEMSAARLIGLGDDHTKESADGAGDGLLNLTPPVEPGPMDLAAEVAAAKTVMPYQAVVYFINGSDPLVRKEVEKNIFGVTLPLLSHNESSIVNVGDVVEIKSNAFASRVQKGKVITPALTFPIILGAAINIGGKRSLVGSGADTFIFKVLGFEPEYKNKESGHECELYVWIAFEGRSEGFEDLPMHLNEALLAQKLKKSTNAPKGDCYRIKYSEITKVISAKGIAAEEIGFIKNNTIIHSFKNNAGEGLAGFIDNLQFDWGLNTIMWDTTPGKRAPQGVKITMNFNPIHDITPGIDADGFNRAPVYKVGAHVKNINQDFDALTNTTTGGE